MRDEKPIILRITRRFEASPERVFDAWLDPAAAGRWLFATKAGVMLRVEIDPRVGGGFAIVEKRGDVIAEHFGRYVEIDRPNRLVFTFSTDRESNPTTVAVEIAPVAGGCELTLTHEMDPKWAAFADRTRSGWTMILEGLAATLNQAQRGDADKVVCINRIIDAPRELVFKMWTDPKHMAQWWGPKGFSNPVCELEARVGGAIRIHMRGPDGVVHPMTGTFREIVEPERLVFTVVAEDAAGKPLIEALTTVTFAEHGGKTILTVQARAVGLAPVAPQMLAGMEAGWTQSLERLAELVARSRS